MKATIERPFWWEVARYTALAAVLAGLYLTSLYSYNLFHGLAEFFSAVVAAAVFVIAWNARRYFANDYVLSLGIALLFVALVDLLHTLAYEGLSVFPGYTSNLATQLWIVARWLQAVALIAAPLLMGRRLRARWYMAAYGALTAILVILVFTWVFPDAFVPGRGLTTFKIVAEYVICAFLLGALGLLVWRRQAFEKSVFGGLVAAIALTIVSEFLFTLYTSPFGVANMGGHLLKIVAFYLIYRAVVRTALAHPYSLVFRELKQSEETLREREEEQRQIADVLQEALLVMPKSLPGIMFGHLYQPATVTARLGGDFYDLFVLPDQEIGLLIGDVSGHGLEAAALTAVAKNTIEAFAFDNRSPAAALQKANLVTMRSTSKRVGAPTSELAGASTSERATTPSSRRAVASVTFVTAFYGILDTDSGRLRFASAGHPPGIIKRASGKIDLLSGNSPVLGVFPDARYKELEDKLVPGDLLLLYTDGLTDVRWGEHVMGEERLLELLASLDGVKAPELPEALLQLVMQSAGDARSDDVAVLAVSLS